MKTSKSNIKQPIQLTFGADPEAFLLDQATGDIVSAIEIMERDKYEPIELGEGVNTYYDNCMLEFTIQPASSKEGFVASFKDAFEKINTFLNKKHGDRYRLITRASHEFNEKYLQHPAAREVGCNPEFSADLKTTIVPPDFMGNLRSAGGHIAVGRADFQEKLREKNAELLCFESKMNLVKLMDYFIGVPFTLIDNDPSSKARRAIYGSPSSHRPKDFGIEYRVLSCYWISSPTLVELIYDLTELAVQKLVNGEAETIFKKVDKALVNACIRENNKELAAEIVEILEFPKTLQIRLNQLKTVEAWDLYREWDLIPKSAEAVA